MLYWLSQYAYVQRLDLLISEAAKNGIRLILPLANFEPFLGGMQVSSLPLVV